jgi:hypothetical protein
MMKPELHVVFDQHSAHGSICLSSISRHDRCITSRRRPRTRTPLPTCRRCRWAEAQDRDSEKVSGAERLARLIVAAP